jgi:predicted ATPase/DNA-binding SARP family transcriptional activator/tetratricopeptide (TPR) repeat protein
LGSVQVGILGPLEVRRDGALVPVGGARVRLLMLRLALAEGRIVPVGQLVDAIWEQDPPADAANALQSLVSRLRRAMGQADSVTQEGAGYRLAITAADLDAHRFSQEVRAGRDLIAAQQWAAAAETLSAAAALWRGTALADAAGAAFAMGPAAELEEQRLCAIEDRIEADLRRNEWRELVAELEALVAENPQRERPVALLMDACLVTGQIARGLSTYERLRSQLVNSLGTDPGPGVQKRYHELLQASGPLPVSKNPIRRNNLRNALTSFVGREADVARLVTLIAGSRLVTLVGAGGAGKTRLANEVARTIVDATPDGVWFVELAALNRTGDLAQSVLNSLGVQEDRLLDSRPPTVMGGDAVDRIVDALAGRESVLVLDNCEHLIDDAADLTDRLLAACPDLRIVATSREPLGITGETVFALGPLSHPTGENVGLAKAMESPAVQLFVDRAKAARSDFVLDEATVAQVIEICRRLDGLPLALELAAARVRSLPIDEVASLINDRFRMLTGGSRTALPRHRTLRAVVEWSWELLNDDEKRLIEELAVFADGMNPHSAAAVCTGSAGDADMLSMLLALADKSLLQPVDGTGLRFRMLETIKEFGQDRMLDAGRLDDLRARHASYFLALAIESEPLLRSAEQLPWIETLRVERDNLYGALQHMGDIGDADGAVQLAGSLAWFWTLVGSHSAASLWLGFALGLPGGSQTVDRSIATAMYAVNSATLTEEISATEMLHSVQVDLARPELIVERPMVLVLRVVGSMFAELDEDRSALMELGRQSADPWVRAAVRMLSAFILENSGEPEQARQAILDAYEQFQAIGDRWGLGSSLESLARISLTDGDVEGALNAFAESGRYLNELGASSDVAGGLCWTALTLVRVGRFDEALAAVDAARDLFDEFSSPHGEALCAFARAEVLRLWERWDEAIDISAANLAYYRESRTSSPVHLLSLLLTQRAILAMQTDDIGAATTMLDEAGDSAMKSQDMPIVSAYAVARAELTWRLGEFRNAAVMLGAADVVRGTPDPTNPDGRRIASALVDELGAVEFEEAQSSGRALDRASAFDLLSVRARPAADSA